MEFRVIYADGVEYMGLVFVYIYSRVKGIVNFFTMLTSRTNMLQNHLASVLGQSNSIGKSDNITVLLPNVPWYYKPPGSLLSSFTILELVF
jgi:hypothetical protein